MITINVFIGAVQTYFSKLVITWPCIWYVSCDYEGKTYTIPFTHRGEPKSDHCRQAMGCVFQIWGRKLTVIIALYQTDYWWICYIEMNLRPALGYQALELASSSSKWLWGCAIIGIMYVNWGSTLHHGSRIGPYAIDSSLDIVWHNVALTKLPLLCRQHFFSCILLNDKLYILLQISVKCIPAIGAMSALVLAINWTNDY